MESIGKKKKDGWTWLIIGIVVVCIFMVSFYLMFGANEKTTNDGFKFEIAHRLCIDGHLYELITGMTVDGKAYPGIALAPAYKDGKAVLCGAEKGEKK